MFYPVESLRRGGRFYLCWVADSWPLRFAAITQRQLWSQDIRQICNDLQEVIVQESGRPSNRFSLRLSSQLIRGLVRLYHRKVTIFVGDLCMINAHVMKSTHKRSPEKPSRPHEPRHYPIPRLFEEQPDEERVTERIQNSGNVVARVDDITLKEPTIAEYRPLDTGFGELHPDQPILMISDRTLEMMLARDASSLQHSALDLQLDFSTDKSHEKSRLVPHESAQMERISEHEMSMFRKSIGADLKAIGDFEKEIPEISEIPIPEVPAPQEIPPEVEKELAMEEMAIEKATDNQIAHISLEEIELEDLQQEQLAKKRKRVTKLKIDKKTKLSSNYLRSRIANNNVELRCEDSIDDVINIYIPVYNLLERPSQIGYTVHPNLGQRIMRMFLRNLGTGERRMPYDLETEEPLARRQTRQRSKIFEKIDEEPEQGATAPQIIVEPPEILDNATHPDHNVTFRDPSLALQDPNVSVQYPVQEIDITDLPTQRIRTLSQTEKQADVSPAKRPRHSGYVSFRESQEIPMQIDLEINKENIPDNQLTSEQRVTSLLHEAGLADMSEKPETQIQTNTQTQTFLRKDRDGSNSETPLGSLDRTKVSLGESEVTTDSRRFIRDEWGTQGTMIKICKCLTGGSAALDVAVLLQGGPVLPGHARAIAAKCFFSLLKLKQNGFINISKDPDTLAITEIQLGPKFQKVH